MRIFTAFPIPSYVIAVIGGAQELLKRMDGLESIRWCAPDTMHVTLQFFGEMDLRANDRLIGILEQLAKKSEPFVFKLSSLFCFPNLVHPSVLVLGVEEEGNVALKLQGLVSRTVPGLADDSKPWRPHITLGRFKEPAVLNKKIVQSRIVPEVSWKVTKFGLYNSVLRPGGAEHALLSSFKLGV